MTSARAAEPAWQALYETAASQEGFFTTRQAAAAGYSAPLLAHHQKAGRLARVRRGIYRLTHFPPGEHEELVTAWLWADAAGVFSHQTALSLHALSDVLPAQVHLTLPTSWQARRLRVPKGLSLHFAEVPARQRAWAGAVPITAALRTLKDCTEAGIAPDLLRQAARQALTRGLVAKSELKDIEKTLKPYGGNRAMTVRSYASPPAFKQALEQRLKAASANGLDFARRRQLLVFDRFLARVSAVFGDAVMLKGGLVLELRLARARTTKDVDLRLVGPSDKVLAHLQEAGRLDLGDFMAFELGHDAEHPTIQNDGMQYEGQRFRAECRLAGKLYGQRFGVDVAFGDPIFGEADSVTADDVLDFAGIAPPVLRLYPVETHIAEKLHAYTMPRTRPNTRVKDLPDIALLATTQPLRAERLRQALEQTYAHRATHALPKTLPSPPTTWSIPYEQMARDNALPWATLEQVTAAVSTFLDHVLAGA